MRQQKIKLVPCCACCPRCSTSQLAGNESDQRFGFPEEIDIIRSNYVPQSVVSIQFLDDWGVSQMFEDHREVQIDKYKTDFLMTKKLKMNTSIACQRSVHWASELVTIICK